MPQRSDIQGLLPLKPDAFYVLLVLLRGDRHGYAIIREAAKDSDGRIELQAGALYRLLARLLVDGLVVESQRRPLPTRTTSAAGITGSPRWAGA